MKHGWYQFVDKRHLFIFFWQGEPLGWFHNGMAPGAIHGGITYGLPFLLNPSTKEEAISMLISQRREYDGLKPHQNFRLFNDIEKIDSFYLDGIYEPYTLAIGPTVPDRVPIEPTHPLKDFWFDE